MNYLRKKKHETKSSFSIKDDEYISTSNLEELNLLEDEKAEFINNFKSNIESFSLLIMDKDRTDLNNAGLFRIQTLNPEQYSNEEREQQFLKLFNAVERRIKSLNPDLVDFVKAIKPIISMIEKNFYHYVNKNGWQ